MSNKLLTFSPHIITRANQGLHPPTIATKRYIRDGFESCILEMRKHRSSVSEFLAHYKFEDPQWLPILNLPCGNPVTLEVKARHCNVALKHLVQKGHALYIVSRTKHSVLYPLGLAERTHVSISMGRKNEKLDCLCVHEGPLNIDKPYGERGIVAVSHVTGIATAFQRRHMLWQRSRRIGALQAQLGALDWTISNPASVGKTKECEVMLLENEFRRVGNGLTGKGIVSTASMAEHPYLYVTQFEAPVPCAMDAVYQGMYRNFRYAELLKDKEPLHALSWVVFSGKGWPALEVDLHWNLILSQPQVFTPSALPVSADVSHPFVKCPRFARLDYQFVQGAAEYSCGIDEMASRPLHWWSQKNNYTYCGYMYGAREGQIDKLEPTQQILNPFITRAHDTTSKELWRDSIAVPVSSSLESPEMADAQQKRELDRQQLTSSLGAPKIPERAMKRKERAEKALKRIKEERLKKRMGKS